MTEHGDLPADAGDLFEREMRGYSRRMVDEFVARNRNQVRAMEDRYSQLLAEAERLRRELLDARHAAARPAHEEISERVGQILRLADEEAKSERNQAAHDIAALREEVRQETEKLKADARQEAEQFRLDTHEQAERLLSAAQEQADRAVGTATAGAEHTRTGAQADAERMLAEAAQQAEHAVGTAAAQAKQHLDGATARASAIHDGAERRLNLLMSRHTEALRRLTEIRDVVTSLVAGETSRGTLEEEVDRTLAGKGAAAAEGANGSQQPGPAGPRHGPGPQDRREHDSEHQDPQAENGRAAPAAGAPLTSVSAQVPGELRDQPPGGTEGPGQAGGRGHAAAGGRGGGIGKGNVTPLDDPAFRATRDATSRQEPEAAARADGEPGADPDATVASIRPASIRPADGR